MVNYAIIFSNLHIWLDSFVNINEPIVDARVILDGTSDQSCWKKKTLNFITPFYGRVQLSHGCRATSKEAVYFLPLNPHKFFLLISSISEECKAGSNLEPCNYSENLLQVHLLEKMFLSKNRLWLTRK